MSNSFNPPNGFTGAPPTNSTCASTANGCHFGGNFSGSVSITGLPATITGGNTYNITVTVSFATGNPVRAGFQMTALDASNSPIGTWTNAGTGVGITGQFVEHSGAQNFGASNSVSWTVDWIAPTSSGTVTMYAAGNIANGSGTGGDDIRTTSVTGTIMGGASISASISSFTNASCFGACDGTATAMGSGGAGPPYFYAWSTNPPQNTQTATGLCAGTYTVTVSDVTGASGTASVTISEPSELVASITNVTHITCSVPVGSATANANGGTPGYTFNWSNGQNGPTATFAAPGTYDVTVTDANNCIDIAQVTINANTTAPNAEAGPNMTIDCNNATVTLNGTGSSTGANISYAWSGPGIVSGGNTLMPTVDMPGTYGITVTDNTNGCTSSDQTMVFDDTTTPVASAGMDMEINCNVNQVTLDGTASSSGANITYLWTTPNGNIVSGETTTTPTVDASGVYNILVTNTSNGCTAEDDVNVTENITPPTAMASTSGQIDCINATAVVDGTGSSSGSTFSYAWSGPCIVSGANNLMAVVDCAGTYCITVTDNTNGCSSTACVVVNENITLPTADAGPAMVLNCNNPSVTLNGSASSQGANFSYQWTGPNIQSGATTLMPVVGSPGTYTLTVTDTDNGCSATDATVVTETTPPTVTASVNANVDCNGNSTGSATATATSGSPPYNYNWSTGGTSATENNMPAGTHTVTVTDLDNCTAIATVTITEPPVLIANASATGETGAGANDGTATADPTGGTPGYSYDWSNGGSTQTITGLAPGEYTVTVTDANNCTSVETVTVSSFDCSAVAIVVTGNDVSCNGGDDGTATANVSNGATPIAYLWSNGGTTQSIANLQAGTYSVTATDGNNCEVIGNITILEPSALSIASVSQVNVNCNGNSTGEATVEVAGGTPGYTYLWDDPFGQSTQTATNLAAGTYNPTITDNNGCTITTSVEITEPDALEANVSSTDETAAGANDGTATANPTGGTPGYLYQWDDPNASTTSMISDLAPGTYCVTVTDNNACTTSACVEINPFSCGGITTTFSTSDVSCNGLSDGSASIATTGGTEPYTYAWSDGGTGASRSDLSSDAYSVTCTDADNCTTTITFTINEPPAIVLTMTSTEESEIGAGDGTATADATGGTGGFSYVWNTGDMTATIENLVGGTYCVTVSDASGCTEEDCVEVSVGNCGAALNFGATDVSCNGGADGTANVVVTAGNPPFTIEWSNGGTGDMISGLTAGVYTATVTDPTGCALMGSVEVFEPTPVEALILNQMDLACEGDETGSINGGASGGILPHTFEWSTGSNDPTITNLPAGTYSLTVTDLNMCTASISTEIVAVPDTIAPTLIFQGTTLYLDANGLVNIGPGHLDNGTFDNCELVDIYLDHDQFTCDDIGTNAVLFMALDAAGNCALDTAFVNVWDTIPPVLICPDDIVSDDCGEPITYDDATGTDACGMVTTFLLDGLPSGAIFPTGTSTVTFGGNDEFGNGATCEFTVTVQGDLMVDLTDIAEPTCYGFEDGSLTVVPSGGGGPFSILWNTGDDTETISDLPAGDYSVTVVDANGCEGQASITLEQPDPITIMVDEVTSEINDNMDGAISITPSGGTGSGYMYAWFFDGNLISNDEDITGLSTGNYIIIVSDDSDCTNSDTVFVDMVVGFDTPEIVEHLSLQPNPNTGAFLMDIQLGEVRAVKTDIFDYTGKQIRKGKSENILDKRYEFDLSDYPEGVYLVRIVIDEVILTRKVVVSRW